jgi:SAM-dependent methyltransferase
VSERGRRPVDESAERGAVAYRGDDGAAYLEQRQGALTDHVQSLRASLFQDLGAADKTIVDFGCGTGGLLNRLEAGRRVGIEIGEAAAALARESGIEVHSSLDELADDSADVVVSFHAIEHVERPIDILCEIGRVTKPGGTIRLVVPGELATHPEQGRWRPNSDRHLHTWTPLLLGNLAERCGYRDIATSVAPMPTGSRLVKALSPLPALARAAHWHLAKRRNLLNVILNARPPG